MDAVFTLLLLAWSSFLLILAFRTMLAVVPQAANAGLEKQLVLDLDETLVHSTLKQNSMSHHSLNLLVEGAWRQFHVIRRPHLNKFLHHAAARYKVILFTAGLREYADPLITLLDPKGGVFSHRYFRESCVNRGGYFIKDLTKIDINLQRGFLVDNSEMSYSLQKGSQVGNYPFVSLRPLTKPAAENGVPIPHFFDDPHDEALLNLSTFLDSLLVVGDVRSIISTRLV